ncbi:type VI secretion system-associated FHA domain protein TagH [Pseudomonas sp. FP2338]|uniref:type VI secretion system-associated FHA domain protein TagH n=1 Tax=Pseudomonas sp. FP2338 TaxID=2954093 RepID=UPI00273425FB|nr:type VI secretion system-associated FHA domain protein TagH [Pseudomonas sp. FP2338]WLH87322.1 type VI secretion system-associated FHA domain protein TagH [Pseudomonas sp. FP2338]
MRLVLEVCEGGGGEPPPRKVFDGIGGVFGRGAGCDWIIPDPSRLLSSHHGLIAYRDARYFLTDISSNGIREVGSGKSLQKGQARLIVEGDVFQLGPFAVRARLIERVASHRQPLPTAGGVIPEDAYLGLDPVHEWDRQSMHGAPPCELDALNDVQEAPSVWMSGDCVERDYLALPAQADAPGDRVEPVLPDSQAPAADEGFWAQFATALGVSVQALDCAGREALAIKAANLLRHAIDGLQQNLRTHEELHNELRLDASTLIKRPNALKDNLGMDSVLAALLGMGELAQPSAEAAITQVYRQMQVHQVALLVACRTALRTSLATFAPGHLQAGFARDDKVPRFFTDRAHWRAYQRHYQRLVEADALNSGPLRGDFAKAYEEQVRLASALFATPPGGCP